ncbi:M23 family metallopeptidase [Paenibacillus kobensis]|uniref:M23 family metallopeptidase n=1 Tax=Paenibacillus kobensis TaxID=59841 RepID=UPI000FDABFCB|nr:M23 family metallopeptidase [Paenibacillus kobensis]
MKWQVMQVSNGVITGFIGTGTPVYAVEAGTVVYLNRTTTCYDNRNPATLCPEAHGIAVKGSDGYYTLYAHVYPNFALRIGSTVQPGTWLGNVDNSGNTTGPHVHFARFSPNANDSNFSQNGTCDWTMKGLVPSNYNGWWQQPNGTLYYFVNGKPWLGWTGALSNGVSYQLSLTTGAWTGWAFFQGRYWFWNGASWENRGTQAPLSINKSRAARSRTKPTQPPQLKRTGKVTRVSSPARGRRYLGGGKSPAPRIRKKS